MRDSLPLSRTLLVIAGLLLAGAVAQPAAAQTSAAKVEDGSNNVVLQSFFQGQLLAPGPFGSGTIPTNGAGTRMMWWPKKAAFRAGRVDGKQWNGSNVGRYSVAFGRDTKAGGFGAVALGDGTTASANGATAMGDHTTAAENSSFTIGECNSTNTSDTDTDEALFVIGNGSYDTLDQKCFRSDALVLDKNGDLKVTGSFVLPDGTTLDGSEDLGLDLPFSNTTSSSNPLFSLTQTGSDRAGEFVIDNANSSANALTARADGSGNAGVFKGGSSGDVLRVLTGGSGDGVVSLPTGTGSAGIFEINNSSSSSTALFANTNGTGFAGEFEGTPSGDAFNDPSKHVALIENRADNTTDDETSANVLALQGGPTDKPGTAVNYISFYDGDGGSEGAIQGTGSGGTELKSTGSDYAEELPVAEGASVPEETDLVGVRGGKISLDTEGADRVMIASRAPVVRGNATVATQSDDARRVPVAFIGQVTARVRGSVEVGDLIVASGQDDGTAQAVSPGEYRRAEHGPIAGQAWSAKASDKIGKVTVAVGLGRSGAVAERLQKQQSQIETLKAENEKIKERLAALEAKVSAEEPAVASLGGSWFMAVVLALGLGGLLGAGLLWQRQS